MSKCKKCNESELEWCCNYSFVDGFPRPQKGEFEKWICNKCDVSVIVPVTIERHFDDADWSCA
jgi:hypothetical protein